MRQIVFGAASLALGFVSLALFHTERAEARMCMTRTCVARAPFVCHGPIGSCGFMQGRCTRYAIHRYFAAHCGGDGGGFAPPR